MSVRFTVRQAADEWQIHPDTVRKAISAGELKATWAGNGWRMLPEDVASWVERKWSRGRGSVPTPPKPA